MSRIKLLSNKLVNQIAAGEVIERPVSIVKELVENSIDADATDIDITFRNGGKSLIIVSDNGIGISKDNLLIACCRHATSKLNDEDLENISYLGFRGEALAAISHVSRFTINSRERGAELAWGTTVLGGVDYKLLQSNEYDGEVFPSSQSDGTKIEISELFCFTPNRLKFLRSEQSENAACIDFIKRLAMSSPKISFSLKIDDRKPIQYVSGGGGGSGDGAAAADDEKNMLKHRIAEVLGQEFIANSVEINYQDDDITIFGYGSIPTYSRFVAAKQKQYCYVNGRMVNDPFLSAIIKAAYSGVIPSDRYPTVVLFLQIPTKFVDVNIHPNKVQIKFWREDIVKKAIFKAIKYNLQHSGISTIYKESIINKVQHDNSKRDISSITGDLGKMVEQGSIVSQADGAMDGEFLTLDSRASNRDSSNHTAQSRGLHRDQQANASRFSSLYRNDSIMNLMKHDFQEQREHSDNIDNTDNADDTSISKQSGSNHELGEAICQIDLTYIFAYSKKGIVVVDQHAAHERLVLEAMKKDLSKEQGVRKQMLLIPQIISLGEDELVNIMEVRDKLSAIGIELLAHGVNQVMVREVPAILGGVDIESLIIDIAGDKNMVEEIVNDKLEAIYSTIACHSSIRAGRKMSKDEMNALLRLIEKTPYSSQCNHGRPTYVCMNMKDVAALFERG